MPNLQTGDDDDGDEPSTPVDDRRHDDPQSFTSDATIVSACRDEVLALFRRSPDRLGLEGVRAFQVHLVSLGLSWPALNQTVCALRFFFGVTLGHAEIPERIAYARLPAKLPTILNSDEIVRSLEAVPSLRSRTALTRAYAAGLRASEYPSAEAFNYPHRRLDPIEMPMAISCKRVMPRQTTILPGGGSWLRAR